MAGAEKFARRSQLHFLWRLEPAVRCALVRDHRDGFLAWPSNGQSQRSTCKTSLAGRERLHESEHARVLSNTETFCSKIFSGCSRDWGSSINRRIWTFCFRSEFPFTLSIHFRTRSTFIGACCDQRNLCVTSFSPSPFFRSWWPVQSCAPVTFSRSFSIRHV